MSLKPIPGPPGHFLLGNVTAFKQNPLACMINWQKEYGDLLRFRLGRKNVYLLSNPDLVEQALIQQPDVFVKMYNPDKPHGLALILGQGLVTSQGELWHKQRRLMQPVFNRSRIMTMLPKMNQAGLELLERWDQMADGSEVNIAQEMTQLMLEVITQTMFSTSVLDEIDEIAPALEIGLRYAAKTAANPLTLPLSIPTKENRLFLQSRNKLDQVIKQIIQQRRKTDSTDDDLLEMLLTAKDPETGAMMSDQQVRDEVITLFSAGHETTANALTWVLYLLAKQKEHLHQVRQEINQYIKGDEIEAHHIQQLSYTRAVFEEAMRLRPPVGLIMRKINQNTTLQGYALKASSLAIFCIYNIHHHPQLWEQPELFNPERFINKDKLRFSYMPFGAGQRFCIGNHFAMTEGILLLSMILSRYDLQLSDESEPEMEMAVTIRPKGGIKMKLHRI